MEKDKTGVQLNLGHTSTDDFITEKYVLPLLRDCLLYTSPSPRD